MSAAAVLESLVSYSLSAHLHQNSLFYAERLYYESPTPPHLNLLAQCYFRQAKYKQTYLILHDAGSGLTDINRYLLSLACIELQHWEEAEAILQPSHTSEITLETLMEVPGGAAGVYLLGKICRKQHRRELAIAYYKICLQMDRYMWCAITDLSEMGVELRLDSLFSPPVCSQPSADPSGGTSKRAPADAATTAGTDATSTAITAAVGKMPCASHVAENMLGGSSDIHSCQRVALAMAQASRLQDMGTAETLFSGNPGGVGMVSAMDSTLGMDMDETAGGASGFGVCPTQTQTPGAGSGDVSFAANDSITRTQLSAIHTGTALSSQRSRPHSGGSMSQRVSLALGLSSLSLQQPFPSPTAGMSLSAFAPTHDSANRSSSHPLLGEDNGNNIGAGSGTGSLGHQSVHRYGRSQNHNQGQGDSFINAMSTTAHSLADTDAEFHHGPSSMAMLGVTPSANLAGRLFYSGGSAYAANGPLSGPSAAAHIDAMRNATHGTGSGASAESTSASSLHPVVGTLFGGDTPLDADGNAGNATGSSAVPHGTGITPLVASASLGSGTGTGTGIEFRGLSAGAAVDVALTSHFATLHAASHSHSSTMSATSSVEHQQTQTRVQAPGQSVVGGVSAARRVSFGPALGEGEWISDQRNEAEASARGRPINGSSSSSAGSRGVSASDASAVSAAAINPIDSAEIEESPTGGEHPHKIARTAEEQEMHNVKDSSHDNRALSGALDSPSNRHWSGNTSTADRDVPLPVHRNPAMSTNAEAKDRGSGTAVSPITPPGTQRRDLGSVIGSDMSKDAAHHGRSHAPAISAPGAPQRSTVKKSARRTPSADIRGGSDAGSSVSGTGAAVSASDQSLPYSYAHFTSQYSGATASDGGHSAARMGGRGGTADSSVKSGVAESDDEAGSLAEASMTLFASEDGNESTASASRLDNYRSGDMHDNSEHAAVILSNSKFDPSFGHSDVSGVEPYSSTKHPTSSKTSISGFEVGMSDIHGTPGLGITPPDHGSMLGGSNKEGHDASSLSRGVDGGSVGLAGDSSVGVKMRLFRQSLSPFPLESSPIMSGTKTRPATVAGVESNTSLANTHESSSSSSSSSVEATSLPGVSASADGATAATAKAAQPPAHSNATDSATQYVASLLFIFCSAQQLLSSFRCKECIAALHSLPAAHFSSGLVSEMIGRAYYELNDYKPSVLAYREMLRLEPFRLKGLEILSTALWHLKSEKDLCSLAQQVVEVDRLCPETWCVVGNCFSLQREPSVAIKFFQRALQIDPSFAYAHTLCGHELVHNENLEKAVASFRQAVLQNDRHYNAWYGLGALYYRQERYQLAEYHFRRALAINSASSVLHCYLAMALFAQGSRLKAQASLDVLAAACASHPKNPQLWFQRANILFAQGEMHKALDALNIVLEHAPKEATVFAMLGQVYYKLGRVTEALRSMNIAVDLDPKESSALKMLVEQMEQEQLDEQEQEQEQDLADVEG